ncbi:MAG TPA: phosphotransferase [Chloroflexota bacterium]|nr:phosphotransferase [Chloroflexota bacterium]
MAVLADLLRAAGLPGVVAVRRLTGRGFDNEVHAAELAGGRRVVLRRWRQQREPEHIRAGFLQAHGVPVPPLLAGTGHASLHEFAPGTLLGDLIETGRASAATWRLVGLAYRRVHDVRFPAGLAGEVQPHQIVLRPLDPAVQLHASIEAAVPRLRRLVPEALEHLPALHALVDRAAPSLRTAGTSLCHGDPTMWNIVVGDDRAWLLDWDEPRIGDPAMEVALLDTHASLFNAHGLDPAFFDGYGHPAAEPNTSLHRVVQTMRWATGPDWQSLEQQGLPADMRARTRGWLQVLLSHVARLPAHLERLSTLV